MIKAVIFDMFETLVSLFQGRTYFSEDIAADIGIPTEMFRTVWHLSETDRSTGVLRRLQAERQKHPRISSCPRSSRRLLNRALANCLSASYMWK